MPAIRRNPSDASSGVGYRPTPFSSSAYFLVVQQAAASVVAASLNWTVALFRLDRRKRYLSVSEGAIRPRNNPIWAMRTWHFKIYPAVCAHNCTHCRVLTPKGLGLWILSCAGLGRTNNNHQSLHLSDGAEVSAGNFVGAFAAVFQRGFQGSMRLLVSCS